MSIISTHNIYLDLRKSARHPQQSFFMKAILLQILQKLYNNNSHICNIRSTSFCIIQKNTRT